VQQGTWTVTSKLPEEAAQTVTREVAIKSIPRKIKTRDQCLISNIPFIQVEVDILAKHRQHPFVNSLYAVIQERDQVHLVLQYCPGGDLFSLIQAYRLDIAQACPRTPDTVAFFLKAMKFWACEIVVALSDLHASHIMHGDMKCENLLIDASGHIRVCDFGLSERHCQGNRVVARHGTELFMSPEQRQQKMLGLAVDAWALGYIFLHMFTLIAPRAHRDGDTENCNMEALRKSEPTTQFERDINNLIGRLLVVDRTQRATMPDVLAHDAFRDVNWKEVRSKSIAVPWIPATDADNFDAAFTALPVKEISAADCTVFTIIPARFS
jgi:serine/threonine protein kinase